MNKEILIYLLLVFLLAASCKNDQETLSLGKELVEPESRLVVLDTFKIEMSTVILDSIQTSGKDLLLTGIFDDSKLGKIVSKSYFEVGFPNYSVDDDEFYDSISLILTYNGYSYGDTTMMQKLTVRKLTDKLQPAEGNYFYNTSSLNYEQDPVGEISFYPRPISGEKFAVSLQNSFGQELFDYIKEAAEDEFKDDEFNNFLKGLVLIPEETVGNSIIGYTVQDTSLCLKIYTHTSGEEQEINVIRFPVKNTNLQFNQITCDWNNNEIFKDHQQDIEIPSSETNGMTFINAGLGMFTRISFPTLPSVVEFENAVLIRAILYVKPAYGFSKNLPDSKTLSIYDTGKHNTLDGQVTDYEGNGIYSNLKVDELYNEETWYSFNITDHIAFEISDFYVKPDKALSISFSSAVIANSMDQLLLGGFGSEISEPRLELFYLFYNLE